MRYYLASCCLFIFLVLGCTEERIPIPKPRLYPKVNYPVRKLVNFDKDFCAFSFKYPDYMVFKQERTFVNALAKHDCWFNFDIPSLNGTIYFTYTDIGGDSLAYKLYDIINDSYSISEKHNLKATGRSDQPFAVRERSLYGITYSVDGDVASPYHFVLTDSSEHALWASLYFNSKPSSDSLGPVIKFVKEDLEGLIESFEWKEK